MQIDRIFYPIEALGPGKRLVIWTIGCSKHCDHCANKELWEPNESREVSVSQLFKIIKQTIGDNDIDGVTFTGGDPMEQCEELLEFISLLRTLTNDVLVYTGFTLEELESVLPSEQFRKCQKQISVLIDGRYVDSLNDGNTPMRGSTNQRMIFWDDSVRDRYNLYMNEGRKIQNVYSNGKMVSVGIHNRDNVYEEKTK